MKCLVSKRLKCLSSISKPSTHSVWCNDSNLNTMIAISSGQKQCIKYTGDGIQKQYYNANNWYYHQIKEYMKKAQTPKRTEQWNWFKHLSDHWHKECNI